MANKKSGYLRQDILNFIDDTINRIGRSPSYREIQAEFNLASSSHVDYHVRMLEKDGLITIVPKENYGIRPTKTRRGIPVKGLIAAGEPLEISDKPDGWIDLGGDLEGKDVYALKVKGKSMIEDGIYDGDYVIVKRQNACEYGEIIVAVHKSTPSSATLKRFKFEQGNVVLQPSNSGDNDVKPIRIPNKTWDEEWEIQGIVIGIFRRCWTPKSRFR